MSFRGGLFCQRLWPKIDFNLCKNLGFNQNNFDFLYRLAEELLAKETLSLPEIVDILGPRPFPLKETLKEYLTELRDRKESDDKM